MQKVRHFCIQIFNGLSSQNDILNIFSYIKKKFKNLLLTNKSSFILQFNNIFYHVSKIYYGFVQITAQLNELALIIFLNLTIKHKYNKKQIKIYIFNTFFINLFLFQMLLNLNVHNNIRQIEFAVLGVVLLANGY